MTIWKFEQEENIRSSSYIEGVDAYNDGQSEDDNPYPSGGANADDWYNGFMSRYYDEDL